MATLSTAGLNAVADALAAFADTGSVSNGPRLDLRTAAFPSGEAVANLIISPAASSTWSAASGGVAAYAHAGFIATSALGGTTPDPAFGTGTVTTATLFTRDWAEFLDLITIGLVDSGSEIEMPSVSVRAGQFVRLDSLDIVVTN